MYSAEKKEMVGIFTETRLNSKGKEGEDWVDEAIGLFGWETVRFDWWQKTVDRMYYKNGSAILAQVKFKEPRTHYRDTGLEKYKFENLKRIGEKSGLRTVMLFTDASGKIYGEFTDKLKDEPHGGEFNKTDSVQMVYFWLKDLKPISQLFS